MSKSLGITTSIAKSWDILLTMCWCIISMPPTTPGAVERRVSMLQTWGRFGGQVPPRRPNRCLHLPAYLEKKLPKNRVPQLTQPPCLSTNPLIFGFLGVRKKEGPKKTSFNLRVSQRTQCHTGPGAARRWSASPYRKIHDLIGVSYQYNPWNIQKTGTDFWQETVEYVHWKTQRNFSCIQPQPWERSGHVGKRNSKYMVFKYIP